METYDVNQNRYESESGWNKEENKTTTLPLVRVLLYVAIGLLITTGVSYGWPWLLIGITGGTITDTTVVLYYIGMIIAFVFMLIGGIYISMKSFKKKTKSVAIMYYLYTIAMGIICSSIFYVATDYNIDGVPIIAIAFGVTAGAMLLAAGLAYLLRKQMNKIIPIVSFLFVGVLVLSLINMFIWPINTDAANSIYWIIDYVIFALVFITIVIDIWRLNTMAKAGWLGDETNLAYYGAYTIYVDFIYILIRVIYYMLIAASKNK